MSASMSALAASGWAGLQNLGRLAGENAVLTRLVKNTVRSASISSKLSSTQPGLPMAYWKRPVHRLYDRCRRHCSFILRKITSLNRSLLKQMNYLGSAHSGNYYGDKEGRARRIYKGVHA